MRNPEQEAEDRKDEKIWRYVDVAKLVSLFERRALFFCRADRLGDPFEGSITRANRAVWDAWWRRLGGEAAAQEAAQRREQVRRYLGVSCWHISQHESAAMWAAYAHAGVALVSHVWRLKLVLINHQNISVGAVQYIDHLGQNEEIPQKEAPIFYKHKSFAHEQELRAVLSYFGTKRGISDPGEYVGIDLEQLVVEVRVAPTQPEWVRELVAHLVKSHGLNVEVARSELDHDPFF